MELRPYQKQGVQWLAGRTAGLLGDQMGLGKTAQYVCAAQQVSAGGRILVLAPEATLPGLRAQIMQWAPGAAPVILDRKGKQSAPASGWMLLGWTSAAARLDDILAGPRLDVLVLDESHRVKNGEAKVTKAVLGKWSKEGEKFVRSPCLAAHANRIWAATGTPAPNRPVELQPLLHLAFGQRWASKKAYLPRFCERPNRWTPSGVDYLGAKNLDELNARLKSEGLILRRTAEDLPGELPSMTVQLVPLAGIREPRGFTADQVFSSVGESGTVGFEEMSAYRAEVGKAKVKAVSEWIDSWLEDNESEALVVFCWHKDVVTEVSGLLREAGHEVVEATGDDSPEHRQELVDLFAGGSGRVFVGTISACGTGLNGLHKRTTTCAFAESAWTPGEMDQAAGRIRRLGSIRDHAQAYILAGEDSLEAHILQTIIAKMEIGKEILSGTAEAAPAPAAIAEPMANNAPELPACEAPEAAPVNGWAWKSLRDGGWGVAFQGPGRHDWAGSTVQVAKRDGSVKGETLSKMLYTCDRFCVFSILTRPETPDERAARYLKYSTSKVEGEDAALTSAEANKAAIAHALCRKLEGMDGDRGAERNDMGWSGATRVWGSRLAQCPVEYWTRKALEMAMQVLNVHKNRQLTSEEWSSLAG
jgi:hypothetical protein